MKVLFIALLLTVTACVNDTAHRYYGDKKYPVKQADEVTIYHSKPSEPFIVIADFQSRGESEEAFRKLAADIGADAIIVSNIGGYYSKDEQWASKDRYQDKSRSRIIASAIKFK